MLESILPTRAGSRGMNWLTIRMVCQWAWESLILRFFKYPLSVRAGINDFMDLETVSILSREVFSMIGCLFVEVDGVASRVYLNFQQLNA